MSVARMNPDVWTQWPDQPMLSKGGEVSNTAYNASLILTYHEACKGVLAFDEFRQKKVKRRQPPWGGKQGDFGNADLPRIRIWMQKNFGLNIGTENLDHAITCICDENAFDSLIDEFCSFQWDGVDRVNTLFSKYFGAEDNPYTRQIARCFLISLAARVFRPGCKVDTMVILEGAQGVRKSSGLRALVGPHLFSDTPIDFNNKDSMLQIIGVLLQEIAELDAFYKSEQTAVKAFITKQEDRFRPAYGREVINMLRRTVFSGTTNESNYLVDSTGSRRFQPIECMRVDIDAIVRDREKLLAEAASLYHQGELWYYHEDSEIATLARNQQSSRSIEDAWFEPISAWLSNRTTQLRDGVTTNQILQECLSVEVNRSGRGDPKRVAGILKQLGWHQYPLQVTRNGARVRIFLPPGVLMPGGNLIDSDLGED